MSQINRNPHDPNKGINTRKYLISVVLAMVMILIASILVVKSRQNSMMRGIVHPKPTSSETPE